MAILGPGVEDRLDGAVVRHMAQAAAAAVLQSIATGVQAASRTLKWELIARASTGAGQADRPNRFPRGSVLTLPPKWPPL
ncbi:MAG: hypothetical protein H0W40_07570 [Methylibium sp.]|uniref:hypothetical protein n=1 Tax=Methylibium sp. TaxID=2067992 RepID=UPI0017EF5C8E|nr:hypothetical protein [Methylibium sp.]MBA3597221.1 hypothetical protein [Methylibium sp.]